MLTSLAARLANSFSSTADGEMNSPFADIATRCNGGTSWYRASHAANALTILDFSAEKKVFHRDQFQIRCFLLAHKYCVDADVSVKKLLMRLYCQGAKPPEIVAIGFTQRSQHLGSWQPLPLVGRCRILRRRFASIPLQQYWIRFEATACNTSSCLEGLSQPISRVLS